MGRCQILRLRVAIDAFSKAVREITTQNAAAAAAAVGRQGSNDDPPPAQTSPARALQKAREAAAAAAGGGGAAGLGEQTIEDLVVRRTAGCSDAIAAIDDASCIAVSGGVLSEPELAAVAAAVGPAPTVPSSSETGTALMREAQPGCLFRASPTDLPPADDRFAVRLGGADGGGAEGRHGPVG